MSEERDKSFMAIKDLIRVRIADDIRAKRAVSFTETEGDPWHTFVVNFREDGMITIKIKVES